MSKQDVSHYENPSIDGSLEKGIAPDAANLELEGHVPFTAAEDKALIRKIDLKILPWVSLLYLLAFLDRANVGNAKLQGLLKSLHMSNTDYNVGLAVFFVSYAFFEVPSNMLLKRLKPHVWLCIITVLFGVCATLMGVTFNRDSFISCRWFLGVFEAGLFPGVQFYLASWYKRNEFGLRSAIFFSAATAAGAFGGLLAAGIAKMNGVGGLGGWAWIFILEGLVTVIFGVLSWWMIPDFPSDARFLSERERKQVLYRLTQDSQNQNVREAFHIKRVWEAFADIKTVILMLMYGGCLCPLYAFSLFLPSILNSLGYDAIQSQLHTVPVYVLACFCTVVGGFAMDRTGNRTLYVMGFSLVGIVGYAILRAQHSNPRLSYAATFLAACGIYPLIPGILSLTSQNVGPTLRRGIVLGLVISWGNLQGVVSSNVYLATESKKGYPTGHTTVLVYLILVFVTAFILRLYLQWENKQRAQGKRDYRLENKTQHEIEMLGDKHPRFVYSL